MYINTLDIVFTGFSSMYDLYSNLRDPIWYWVSFVSFDVFDDFGGWIQSSQWILSSFLPELDWVPSNILSVIRDSCWVWSRQVSPLHSSCRVVSLSAAYLEALLVGSWFQRSPLLSGFSKIISRTASRLQATSQEIAFWLLLFLSQDKEGFSEIFPSLQ